MSNLIKKGCVIKQNKLPARYHLTESGRNLALKLLYGIDNNNEDENQDESQENEPEKQISTSKLKTKKKNTKSTNELHLNSDKENEVETQYNFDSGSHRTDIIEDRLEYNYLNMNDNYNYFDIDADSNYSNFASNPQKNNFNHEICLSTSESDVPNQPQPKKLHKNPSSEDLIEVIDNEDDDDIIAIDDDSDDIRQKAKKNSNTASTLLKPVSQYRESKKTSYDDSDDDQLPDLAIGSELLKYIAPQKDSTAKKLTRSDIEESLPSLDTVKNLNEKPVDNYASKKTSSFAKHGSFGLTQPMQNLTTNNSSPGKSSTSQFKSTSSTLSFDSSLTPKVNFKLLSGTFEVLLFVDNCEQSHAYFF